MSREKISEEALQEANARQHQENQNNPWIKLAMERFPVWQAWASIPAIFLGVRFTTNNACLPSVPRGLGRSCFIPARIVRLWSANATSSAANFSELPTS